MSAPKTGLPSGCYRILRLADGEEPYIPEPGDEMICRVLAGRGLLELLPGCARTYGTTEAGRASLKETEDA